MRVRLTRKFAQKIDGIDLSNFDVGDLIDLPDGKAKLLVAEEWAEIERRSAGQRVVVAFRRVNDPGQLYDEEELSRAS